MTSKTHRALRRRRRCRYIYEIQLETKQMIGDFLYRAKTIEILPTSRIGRLNVLAPLVNPGNSYDTRGDADLCTSRGAYHGRADYHPYGACRNEFRKTRLRYSNDVCAGPVLDWLGISRANDRSVYGRCEKSNDYISVVHF